MPLRKSHCRGRIQAVILSEANAGHPEQSEGSNFPSPMFQGRGKGEGPPWELPERIDKPAKSGENRHNPEDSGNQISRPAYSIVRPMENS